MNTKSLGTRKWLSPTIRIW